MNATANAGAKRALLLLLLVTVSTFALASRPSSAKADAISCAATAESAQSSRQRKKLVEAQKQLVQCASAECPKFVRADCLRWLDEVQSTLPTMVVRASDALGGDVIEGSVSVDGGPSGALGVAMSLDPGPHVVSVKTATDSGELRVLVAEGEKNRVVVVKLDGGKSVRPVGSAPTGAPPSPAPAEGEASTPGRGPWPWIAGGIGAAGLVTFGVLQVAAQDQYDGLKGSCAPRCDTSEVDSVRNKVTFSAVALGVGVLGVGAGVALWFALEPNVSPSASRGLGVSAVPTQGGAAGTLRVRF